MFFCSKKNKKGFSLVELIVVMGIMAILVLVGVPKFLGHTKEANLTKIKASIKEVENAADRYYLKEGEWPRATEADDYYTKQELDLYAKEILDRTGVNIKLDEEGKYYNVDFIALNSYIKVPDKDFRYIIQNPVGQVYYLEELTTTGKEIFNSDDPKTPPKEVPLISEPSSEEWFIIDDYGAVSASDTLKALAGPIDIVIPNTIQGIESKSIKNKGFYNLKNIKDVTIPNVIKSIGASAFYNSSIENINFGNSIETISDYAFSYNSKLTEIILPDSVTIVGLEAFIDCTSVTNIKLSNKLITISQNSFRGITKVDRIEIPISTTSIGVQAFLGWSNSQNIIIKERNNNQLTCGSSWYGLAIVSFENTDDYYVIDYNGIFGINGAFSAVPGSIDLAIPSKINGIDVKSIGNNVFKSINNIKNVTLPNSLTTIGTYAFSSSTIETINFGDSLETIGNNAFDSSKLTKIILPDSVINIGTEAFINCINVTEIELSNNLTTISQNSFRGITKVAKIEIPINIKSIGVQAFLGWTNSQTIKLIGRTDTTGMTIGSNWSGSATVIY